MLSVLVFGKGKGKYCHLLFLVYDFEITPPICTKQNNEATNCLHTSVWSASFCPNFKEAYRGIWNPYAEGNLLIWIKKLTLFLGNRIWRLQTSWFRVEPRLCAQSHSPICCLHLWQYAASYFFAITVTWIYINKKLLWWFKITMKCCRRRSTSSIVPFIK